MSASPMTIKPLPALRLAESTAEVGALGQAQIGPVIGPMFARLAGRLQAAGVAPVGPPVAYYEVLVDGVRIHAGFPVLPEVEAGAEWTVVVLVAVDAAATLVHHGAMSGIDESWNVLRQAIADRPGTTPAGAPRERYLRSVPAEDQSGWVTELQWPVEETG